MGSTSDRARARMSDPATSHAAALSVSNLQQSRAAVLGLLVDHGPCTDEQLISHAYARGLFLAPSGIRTRRHELVTLGLVEDTGQRGTTEAGRQTVIWQATQDPWTT